MNACTPCPGPRSVPWECADCGAIIEAYDEAYAHWMGRGSLCAARSCSRCQDFGRVTCRDCRGTGAGYVFTDSQCLVCGGSGMRPCVDCEAGDEARREDMRDGLRGVA